LKSSLYCFFPPVSQDVLLYLTLTGIGGDPFIPDINKEGIQTMQDLQIKVRGPDHSGGNTYTDWAAFESLVASSLTLALNWRDNPLSSPILTNPSWCKLLGELHRHIYGLQEVTVNFPELLMKDQCLPCLKATVPCNRTLPPELVPYLGKSPFLCVTHG
jgi:hypothetical protein